MIVNDEEGPAQLLAVGVTMMVAVTGAIPALTAVNDAILPVPVAANPMLVVLLVQLYVVPATLPVKFIVAVEAEVQRTWLAG